MQKIILAATLIVLMASLAFAEIDWKTADCAEISQDKKTFELYELTKNTKVFSFADGETVNTTVFRQGPPFMMSGKIESEIVRDFSCTHRTDATMGVYIQQEAIERMNNAHDQVGEFIKLKEEGGIKVEAYSFGAQAKLAIGEFALWISQAFGITDFF